MENVIGEIAGKVWRHLNESGEQPPSVVAKALNIKVSDLDRALGWLAREDKLSFSADNVVRAMGENAGLLWRLLKERGASTPATVAKLLGLKNSELDQAIGWLAREGKLSFGLEGNGSQKLSIKEE